MMKVETTLAQSLRTLDGNAQYDAACKRLLSEKIILAWIILCLGNPDGENYRGVLKLLGTLFSNEAAPVEKQQILENDFGIQMTETLGKELQAMCNLSEGIEAKGFARGIEKGRAEGRAEGRIEGILASLQSLMDSMGLALEQAMNTLKISEGDRLKCRGLMEKQ